MGERDFEGGDGGGDSADLGAALKDAEAQVRAAQRRLAEIQSLTRVGSWEWELSAERATWSPELRRIAQLAPDEPVPSFQEFVDHIHPDDRAGYLEAMREALENGGSYRYRHRMVLPDGSLKVIETNAQVESDPEGTPVRVYGATQDVTDRMRDEASLRLQSDLLDQVEIAVMASDLERRLTNWNRGAEKLLGVPRAEALGQTIDEVMPVPPESQKARLEMVAQLVRGEKWEGELVLQRRNGEHFPAFATNAPVHDAEGDVIGYSGVIMDLTEMKEAHAELRRRADEQALIAALSRMAMSSEAIEELAGQAARSVAEMLGAPYAEVLELKADGHGLVLRACVGRDEPRIGTETTLDAASLAAHTLAGSGPLVVEDYAAEERFSPFGDSGPAAHSGAAVAIEGGDRSYGILAVHTTVPRRFSAENVEFLQSIANVLAGALARQRAQRLESQVHQNQRLEAVGQLAGGVAHDFNNLLVVILNYAEFLREQTEDADMRADIDEIRTAAERAANLTHQLLVFSRREVVVPEAVDLNEVVAETESLLRHTLREHIKLVRSCEGDLWRVRLGSGQAEQILINLLVNARDAMPDGGTVEIKTENLELGPGHGKLSSLPEGRYVRITVADSGTGMEEQVAAQVFDPFFTTKKDAGGTGLGLATVYGIVQDAQGHIEVYTEPGLGTAFKIYLPAIAAESEGAEEPQEPAPASGQTILLVEDEDSVRRLAERILAKHGHRVLTATDGVHARGVADDFEGEIHLLVTDVVMPNLSGPQLAQDLRTSRPGMRALFMSGYTGEVISRDEPLQDGTPLLEKPFDSKGLLRAVARALQGPEGEGR